MNKGQVKEFDSPYTLLQRPKSQFKKMVGQTGPVASAKLYQMAQEAHQNRAGKSDTPGGSRCPSLLIPAPAPKETTV